MSITSEKEIIEGDVLIAIYMKFPLKSREEYAKEVGCPEEELINMPNSNCPQYSNSWDLLMPVIDEIFSSEEYYRYKRENESQFHDGSIYINPKFILSTWEEVIDFVKWYNLNKK